jgi:hypothetical protein
MKLNDYIKREAALTGMNCIDKRSFSSADGKLPDDATWADVRAFASDMGIGICPSMRLIRVKDSADDYEVTELKEFMDTDTDTNGGDGLICVQNEQTLAGACSKFTLINGEGNVGDECTCY